MTEAGLGRVQAEHALEVRYRAFERFPAPSVLAAPPEVGAARSGAQLLGLPLEAPGFRPRTRKAHEAARFAAERGMEARYRAAVYSAYWGDGRDVGRIDVLAALAEEVGLDPVEARIALDIDRHREAVLSDETLAARLGVTEVPTLFLGLGAGARVLQGARTVEALDAALRSL